MTATQNSTYQFYYVGYLGVRAFAGRVPTNFEEYLSAKSVNILLLVGIGFWI
jgi:hypothetical protein